MAKAIKIDKNSTLKNSGRKISEVEMSVSFSSDNKLVILETFGSKDRKEKGKTSQVIHLDKEIAQKLIDILREWI